VAYWPFWGFALIGVALAVWEGYAYHNKTSGTVVSVKVEDCRVDPVKARASTCTGTWVLDGRRERGTIEDVGVDDIGRTVKAHLHDGRAWAHNRLIAPVVFFFVGILFALGWIYAAWRNAGANRPRPAAAAGLPSG
jgi:hypothetical protein